jgi:hypothetical protein
MNLPRAGVDHLGTYRCSAEARRTLQRLGTRVAVPVTDWYLWKKLRPHFPDLDPLKENRSVTSTEWVAEGIAKFGCPVHVGEPIPESLRGSRNDRSTGTISQTTSSGWLCRCGNRGANRNRAARAVRGSETSGRGTGLPGQAHASDPDRERGPFPNPGPHDLNERGWGYSQSSYQQAYNATRRMAGGGERRRKPLELDEVVASHVHMGHFSGAPFFARNEDCVVAALERADRIHRGTTSFDPFVAGRRVQFGPSGPKTRLVWMAPLATTLLSTRFSAPVHKGLARRLPFAYGYSSVEKAARISSLQSKYRYVYSLDFSGFDASLSNSLIRDAFSILETHLEMNDDDEGLLSRIVDDFIHTRLVTPDGDMYRVHGGVPSGSSFTSLVDSMCNLLVVMYTWIRITGRALTADQLWILGDDVIIADDHKMTMHMLASAAAPLGVTVNAAKSSVTGYSPERDAEPVHFLGHYWISGRMHRPVRELVTRLVFPERWSKQSKARSMARFVSMMADAYEMLGVAQTIWPTGDTWALISKLLLEIDESDDGVIDMRYDLPGRLRFLAVVEQSLEDDLSRPGFRLPLYGQTA